MEGTDAQNGGVWSIIHPVGSILVNIWSVFPLIKIFIWQNSGLTARVYRPIREFSSHHKYLIYILYISVTNLTNNRFTGLKKFQQKPLGNKELISVTKDPSIIKKQHSPKFFGLWVFELWVNPLLIFPESNICEILGIPL